MLEGGEFLLFTDHKPLTSALFRSSPPWSARQQRHLAYIAEFTSSIVHVPGLENIVADALSRPGHTPPVDPSPVVPPGSSSPTSPSLLQTSTSSQRHAPDSPLQDPHLFHRRCRRCQILYHPQLLSINQTLKIRYHLQPLSINQTLKNFQFQVSTLLEYCYFRKPVLRFKL